jgi:hypothetical protein
MGAGTPLRTAGGPRSVVDEPGLDGTLVEVARAAAACSRSRGGEGDWGVAVEGFWCTVRPPGQDIPSHGRRLSVSASARVAVEVLAAVAAAIADDPCVFTFVTDRGKLHEMNSRNGGPGPAGTFITVHPVGEGQFRRIAQELQRATFGLPGAAVLPGCAAQEVDPAEGRGSTVPEPRKPGDGQAFGRYETATEPEVTR